MKRRKKDSGCYGAHFERSQDSIADFGVALILKILHDIEDLQTIDLRKQKKNKNDDQKCSNVSLKVVIEHEQNEEENRDQSYRSNFYNPSNNHQSN